MKSLCGGEGRSVFIDAQTLLWAGLSSEPFCFVLLWQPLGSWKGMFAVIFLVLTQPFLPHDGSAADLGLCLCPRTCGQHSIVTLADICLVATQDTDTQTQIRLASLVHADLGIFWSFLSSILWLSTHHCLKPYSSNALTGKYQLNVLSSIFPTPPPPPLWLSLVLGQEWVDGRWTALTWMRDQWGAA